MGYLFARAFDDFDELQEAVRAWDLDLRQLDRGSFEGQVLQVGGERLQVSHARFGRALEQRGSPPSGLWTFAIPSPGCPPFLWRSHRITPNRLAIFQPGSELDAVSRPGFEVFTLSVAEEDLPEGFDRREVWTVPPERMRRLRVALGEAVRGALHGGGVAEEEVLECLAGCAGARRPSGRIAAGRRELMTRAVSHLMSDPRRPVTVAELCRELAVNERTLRRAFRERFDLSPKAYLTALRLNGARRDLRAGPRRTCLVSEVARAWGFRHLGQFSVRYREHFGESPSATRRR